MKEIYVAAACIIKDEKIFMAQRGYGEFKDKREFPGGKVERGESSSEAVVREIKEEFDSDIMVDCFLTQIESKYPEYLLKMDVFICRLESNKLIPLEAENLGFFSLDQAEKLDMLEGDKKALSFIHQYFNKKKNNNF